MMDHNPSGFNDFGSFSQQHIEPRQYFQQHSQCGGPSLNQGGGGIGNGGGNRLSPSEPDVDWSVFENAERFLLRDDSAWIQRLSKDFWWNLERISEMIQSEYVVQQQIHNNTTLPPQAFTRPPLPPHTIHTINKQQAPQQQQLKPQYQPVSTMQQQQPPRKLAGRPPPSQHQQQLSNYRNGGGFLPQSPPPSSSSSSSSGNGGSTITRPTHMSSNNIPDKPQQQQQSLFNPNHLFHAFSSLNMGNGLNGASDGDNDREYNPFQSKISFDNNLWATQPQQQPVSMWQ